MKLLFCGQTVLTLEPEIHCARVLVQISRNASTARHLLVETSIIRSFDPQKLGHHSLLATVGHETSIPPVQVTLPPPV